MHTPPSTRRRRRCCTHWSATTPWVDGNKRLAWAATRIFCILNGHDLAYTVDDAEQLMLGAAAGQLDAPHLARWIRDHRR